MAESWHRDAGESWTTYVSRRALTGDLAKAQELTSAVFHSSRDATGTVYDLKVCYVSPTRKSLCHY